MRLFTATLATETNTFSPIPTPLSAFAKVRQQLTEYGLVAEEYGGDTLFIDVSARANLNIDGLLEGVLLTADAALDLRANPDQDAQGIVIEARPLSFSRKDFARSVMPSKSAALYW